VATLKIAVAELGIIILGSAFIVACCALAHQPGYGTSSIVFVGLALVAVASAWAVRRETGRRGFPRRRRTVLTVCCTGLAVFATLLVSMTVLVNTYGS